jgi:hypothetical protein
MSSKIHLHAVQRSGIQVSNLTKVRQGQTLFVHSNMGHGTKHKVKTPGQLLNARIFNYEDTSLTKT